MICNLHSSSFQGTGIISVKALNDVSIKTILLFIDFPQSYVTPGSSRMLKGEIWDW